MRKLILFNVVTLDGCFEGEKAWDLDFHNLVWGPELEALSVQHLTEADMLVFGENTYKGMAEWWPKSEESDPVVAPLMNSIAKIVCSPTLEKAGWNNTRIVRDAVKEIAEIKGQGDRPMYIFGSAILAESLMNAGLIDEVRLIIAPIILGKGRRLFTEAFKRQNLKLVESRSFRKGGVLLKYEVTG